MSFGAMATWQALALIGVAGAAAAVLFLVKVRPPRVQVPTLLIWRRVLDHAREMTWWERIRKAVSLAATVLVALALALAVTRPGPPRSGPSSQGRTLIVLDSSWSMAARTSSGETRWQRAVRQARTLASSASGGDVALATTADGLVEGPTSDAALIETAIDRLAPAGGDRTVWPRVAGTDHVHFITDGATAHSMPSDKSVTVHSVYEAAANVAIIAFGARPSVAESPGEAYLQVANYGDAPKSVRVIVSRGATVISDQRVDMASGEAVSQIVPLAPAGSARLMARIDSDADALAEDNEAVAWIDGAESVDVTVVSEDASAIAAVLKHDPTLRVSYVVPADYKPGRPGIVIFDRWAPSELPAQPALFLSPPESSWLGKPGAEEKPARWSQVLPHAVVDGVDPLTIDLKRARPYSGTDLRPVVRSDKNAPLVSVVDSRRFRIVVWSFALAEANAASAPGFPILIGNTIEWLARPSYGVMRRPGPVRLPADATRVVAPDGKPIEPLKAGDSSVARFSSPGLYLVDAGGSRGVVGINVGDPDVSNLSRSSLSKAATTQVAAGAAGWPWWLWAVFIAFLLSAAEWWTWQRRVTV